jgi:pyruvoyl-dependent arginine decarboxylase (PvlArgDC)
MNLSPNMTKEHLEAVFKALPENLDDGELCAITLSIYSEYRDGPGEIISALISTIYTLGLYWGMSRETVSEGLRKTADMYDEEHAEETAH